MAQNKRKFGRALKRIRKQKGWSTHQLQVQTNGVVGRQSIINMEEGLADPEKIAVKTMVALVDALWPSLDISHFTGGYSYKYIMMRKGPEVEQ